MARGKVVFTRNFWEYFLMSLGLLVLTMITLGMIAPYYIYWNFAYFFKRMEIEIG